MSSSNRRNALLGVLIGLVIGIAGFATARSYIVSQNLCAGLTQIKNDERQSVNLRIEAIRHGTGIYAHYTPHEAAAQIQLAQQQLAIFDGKRC